MFGRIKAMQLNDNADALVFASLHALAFALVAVIVKLLSGSIPVLEQTFTRSMIGLGVLALGLRRVDWVQALGPAWPLLVLRGVLGFIGVSCMFYTVGRLPLVVAMILTLITPVFVMGLAWLFLNETMSRSKIAASLLILFCVMIVAIPADRWRSPLQGQALDWRYLIDLGIGLFGSIATAAAFVSMRAALKQVSVKTVVLYFMVANAGFSLLLGGANFVMPQAWEWLALLALGLFGTLSDVFKTRAYQKAVAGIVSVLSLLSIVFAAILGWTVFQEAISLLHCAALAGLVFGLGVLTRQQTGLASATSVANKNAPAGRGVQ
jgi:drug/metabolite transporter (DMT)-like permease